jgi:reactive intermediate/imine deaminase
MSKTVIATPEAPSAIGPYSQAIRHGQMVFLSGQIPLVPATMTLVEGDFDAEAVQVFENLKAVAAAAGGSLADTVKLTIFLTDLARFVEVNEVMTRYFDAPYPARATVQVSALPRGAHIEIDAILCL